MTAAVVVAGAAGLMVLGAGVAAADPTLDDGSGGSDMSGHGSTDLPDVEGFADPTGSGDLLDEGPAGDGLDPFVVGRDDNLTYGIHSGDAPPSWTPAGAAADDPGPLPAARLPDRTAATSLSLPTASDGADTWPALLSSGDLDVDPPIPNSDSGAELLANDDAGTGNPLPDGVDLPDPGPVAVPADAVTHPDAITHPDAVTHPDASPAQPIHDANPPGDTGDTEGAVPEKPSLSDLWNSRESARLGNWVPIDGGPGDPTAPDEYDDDAAPIRYQYQPGVDGVGDFVRISEEDTQSANPSVMIEPGPTVTTFSVFGNPTNLEGPWLRVDTARINHTGTSLAEIARGFGGEYSIPASEGVVVPDTPGSIVTGRPITRGERDAFTEQEFLRLSAARGVFAVPSETGELLRFSPDLVSPDEAATPHYLPQLPGQASMNCTVGGTHFCFDDAGNVAVTRTTVGADGVPVATREYRVTAVPNDLSDRLPTPPVTWVFDPGTPGGNGSFTAFPGLGDSTDLSTVALQVNRDARGEPLWAQIAGGSNALNLTDPDMTYDRDPDGVALPDVRSWRGSTGDQNRMPYSSVLGPGYSLQSEFNPVSGDDELSGVVRGVRVGPYDIPTGQMFTRLAGIPNPANPANLDVRSGDPRASVTLSRSTDPGPLHVLADNSLSWTTTTGETYRIDPYEYEEPAEPGGVARGTGTYRQRPDGSWAPVDPTTVPTVLGLWGSQPPPGQVDPRWPDHGGGGDGGPGIDRRPWGAPNGGAGDPSLTPAGGGGSTRMALPESTPETVPDADVDGPSEVVPRSTGGVSVVPEPTQRPSLDDLRRQLFPGGDPRAEAPGSVADDTVAGRPPSGEVDGLGFDPNRAAREPAVPEPPLQIEGFPSGPDRELEGVWSSGVPGLLTGPPVSERDREPGDPLPTTPSSAAGTAVEPSPLSNGTPSVALTATGPGTTRTGSDGRTQTYLRSQHLIGDGRPGTAPGRIDYFTADSGITEAVVTSPRHTHDDGTTTVWIPNLGTTVSTNPAAQRVTSVQRVPTGTSAPMTSQAIRIRTAPTTHHLTGTGPGSTPGTVTYQPVPENPRLHDVTVQPTVTDTPHPDGSRTLTYTALVPANRQFNADGNPERFRVAVDAPMREARRSLYIPPPPPPTSVHIEEPDVAGAPSPAFDTPAQPAGSAQPTRSAQPTQPTRRAPSPQAPAPQSEPDGWQQAGQLAVDILTYPHPLDPVRGQFRDVWKFLPGAAGGATDRQYAF